MNLDKSAQHFEEAKTYFPGGVNSPVRAFKSVQGTPVFVKKGKGSKFWDEDGNEFIDFCCSWGPLILGHAHDSILKHVNEAVANGTSFGTPTVLENKLGKLIIDNNRFIEKIRFVSSGTEAVMSAIRLARGYTNRNKIIKFEGCYHGHSDALLVSAGSGLVTLGNSSSAGVPDSVVSETIVLPLNNKEAVKQAFEQYKNEIACVIIEPIPANNGLLLQTNDFLGYLREVCTQEGTLLMFDEVISGFRVGFEGAAGLYNIQPDLISYGKIIGGGFPVGAYASSAKIMDMVAPLGPVYQAGTLSGNPVAMAAGFAQLTECLKPNFYQNLDEKTDYFVEKIKAVIADKNLPFTIYHQGSIFWFAFTKDNVVREASSIDAATMPTFGKLYHKLLTKGMYLGPSGYEVGFVSEAHSLEDLDKAAAIFSESLLEVFEA